MCCTLQTQHSYVDTRGVIQSLGFRVFTGTWVCTRTEWASSLVGLGERDVLGLNKEDLFADTAFVVDQDAHWTGALSVWKPLLAAKIKTLLIVAWN